MMNGVIALDGSVIIGGIAAAMARYMAGDAARINHFMKVYAYADAIARAEGLGGGDLFALRAAALTHDIGIREGIRRFGDSSGKRQEEIGPGEALPLLRAAGVGETDAARVCGLIGSHHTYGNVGDPALQILIEADFIVNIYEEGLSADAARGIRGSLFKTSAGKAFADAIFLSDADWV
jgi:hypothetical protein